MIPMPVPLPTDAPLTPDQIDWFWAFTGQALGMYSGVFVIYAAMGWAVFMFLVELVRLLDRFLTRLLRAFIARRRAARAAQS